MKEYYLDYAASTPVNRKVVEVMNKFYLESYGNPSSLHAKGEEALRALEDARKKFAKELGCKPGEIYFTSGATESNNIVLKNFNKIIMSPVEHPSVKYANKSKELKVDSRGNLILEKINADLISVIHGNNVFGTVQDLKKIGKSKGKALFHTDATQTFGKLKINVRNLGIDFLSASAHKIGGPKGVGLLYVKSGVKLNPLLSGGGQEFGLRGGTENIPGIVGFAKALDLVKRPDGKIKEYFVSELGKIGGKINGDAKSELGIINVFFSVEAENLIYALSEKGIYISAGSACDSKKEKEDYVLRALGLSKKEISGSVRISFGSDLKKKDVDYIIKQIDKSLKSLK